MKRFFFIAVIFAFQGLLATSSPFDQSKYEVKLLLTTAPITKMFHDAHEPIENIVRLKDSNGTTLGYQFYGTTFYVEAMIEYRSPNPGGQSPLNLKSFAWTVGEAHPIPL
jgi:hypothetical protein